MRAHGRRRQRGIAAVEFALTAPVLLLLFLATAEVGRAFVQYTTLANATRDATRYLAGRALSGTSGVVVQDAAFNSRRTEAANLLVYGNVAGTGRPRLPGLSTSGVTVAVVGTNSVAVRGTYAFQPAIAAALPSFGFGAGVNLAFNMAVQVQMRGI